MKGLLFSVVVVILQGYTASLWQKCSPRKGLSHLGSIFASIQTPLPSSPGSNDGEMSLWQRDVIRVINGITGHKELINV